MKILNSSDLNNLFTGDHLISLGFKYQKGIAIPFVVGRSRIASRDNGEDPPEYDDLDVCLKRLGLGDGETVYICLGK